MSNGQADSGKEVEIRAFRDGDQSAIAHLLQIPLNMWEWKYTNRPGFSRSLLLVAMRSHEVIGTLARVPARIRVGADVAVDAILEGDLMVSSKNRLEGLGRKLMENAEYGSATLSYGFASVGNFRKFHKKMGQVRVADNTMVYTRFLTTKGIANRISTPPDKKLSRTKPFIIGVRLRGIPAFLLQFRKDSLEVKETISESAAVIIEGDYSTLRESTIGIRRWDSRIRSLGKGTMVRIAYLILTRQLKVRGSIPNIIRAVSIMRRLRLRLTSGPHSPLTEEEQSPSQ